MKKQSKDKEIKRSESPMVKMCLAEVPAMEMSSRRKKPSFQSGMRELEAAQNRT